MTDRQMWTKREIDKKKININRHMLTKIRMTDRKMQTTRDVNRQMMTEMNDGQTNSEKDRH